MEDLIKNIEKFIRNDNSENMISIAKKIKKQ